MKKISFLIGAIIAVTAAFILIFLPINFDFPENESVKIWLDRDETHTENYAALPSGDPAAMNIAPASSEYQELLPLLKNLRYSYCVHTVTASWFPPNERGGLLHISILDADLYITQSS